MKNQPIQGIPQGLLYDVNLAAYSIGAATALLPPMCEELRRRCQVCSFSACA